MLGRKTSPASSNRTSAGTMPVTQSPLSARPSGSAATRSRRTAQEFRHHSAGSSSAQPGCGEESVVLREATATIAFGGARRTPIVDVVPMSRPMTRSRVTPLRSRRSCELPDIIHEALHSLAVHRLPRIAVNLEMGADDAAVGDRENLAHIVDANAGIGEDRNIGDGFAHFPEIGRLGALAGQRAGNQNGVGQRRKYRALGAKLDWPRIEDRK